MPKSIEFPFGDDVDTMIVCHNDTHKRICIKAFGIKARYATFGSLLAGYKYKKIIVFAPAYVTDRHRAYIEHLKCKLDVDCLDQLYVV